MARNRGTKTWRKLTRKDLAAFDDYGVKAVQYAMDHGGVGKVSNRGHVMLKAPDGRIMGVAADTRKARQVIAIGLRDLFGNGGLEELEPAASAGPSFEEIAASVSSAVTTLSGGYQCWEPNCTQTFVTEGAVYAHAHNRHHVCPHPGCHFTRDKRHLVTGHFNMKHGEHPRRKARRLQEEAAAAAAATVSTGETNHPAVEAPHDESPTSLQPEALEPEPPPVDLATEMVEAIRRIDSRLARLEADNQRLRQALTAALAVLAEGGD